MSKFVHRLSFILFLILILEIKFISCDNLESFNFLNACGKGDFEWVAEKLKTQKGLASVASDDGETCLHLCAIKGSVEIVELLLKNGADPNARTTHSEGLRMHPLSWHVYGGHYRIVSLLLQNGANVNADFDIKNKNGYIEKSTILDVSRSFKRYEDEDMPSSDINGNDNQEVNDHENTYKILLQYGAKTYDELHQNDKKLEQFDL